MSKDSGASGIFGAMGDVARQAEQVSDVVRDVAKHIATQQARRDMEEIRRDAAQAQTRMLAEPPPIHGSARWASRTDLQTSGYLRDAAAYTDDQRRA